MLSIAVGTYEGVLCGWRGDISGASTAAASSKAPADGSESSTGSDGSESESESSSPLKLVYAFDAHGSTIKAVSLDKAHSRILATGSSDETIKYGCCHVSLVCNLVRSHLVVVFGKQHFQQPEPVVPRHPHGTHWYIYAHDGALDHSIT